MSDVPNIAALIPHADAMCLLNGVEDWDAQQIRCTASGHTEPAHPLADDLGLPAIALCEFGAQAAAVHGALLADGQAQPGHIAAFRGVRLHCQTVPADASPLTITAQRLAGSAAAMQYSFSAAIGGQVLADGRLTVALLKPDDLDAAAQGSA